MSSGDQKSVACTQTRITLHIPCSDLAFKFKHQNVKLHSQYHAVNYKLEKKYDCQFYA